MRTNKEMQLASLRADAERLRVVFLAAIKSEGFADEWTWYRAESKWDGARFVSHPVPCLAQHAEWIHALHRFYVARDGVSGFLGSRGL